MVQIKLLVEGGAMQPGPALAQKIGPLGLNVGQIIQKVNDATNTFKGMKVPVELDVDPSTKEIKVNVFSPPVSGLIKKELGIDKGSGTQKKLYSANASIEQIISIAKNKQNGLLCKDLKSSVKTVVGTCVSLGILVENKLAKEVEKEIDEGKYDKEIKEELTETPNDKKEKLSAYFNEVRTAQEKVIKQEEAAKEAESQAKEASKEASKETVASGEGSKPEDKKEEIKSEDKKPEGKVSKK
jgi:large subunit ribosomal protein L11